MITRKVKHVVVFAFALGLLIAAIPSGDAASPGSTIYSFGTITPDGAVPKGSLTYVNGFLFGRTTTTYKAAHGEPHYITSAFTVSSGQTNNDNGSKPIDNVILVNGWLYGMTTEGGTHGQGAIFKVSPIPGRRPTSAPRPTPPPPLEIRSTTT